MNRATAMRDRDAGYLETIDANLREVQRILKRLAADRKRKPLVERRRVSIVREVKEILGKR